MARDQRQRSRASSRLKRAGFSLLPKWIRHRVIRRAVHYPWSRLDKLYIEIAHDAHGYEAAFRLVHDAYVERGWIKPQPSGMWRTAHQALPEATVLVLHDGEDYVGTVTLVADSELGLPIDHTYPTEMAGRRGTGKRLVEVGSLAVARSVRRSGAWMCMAVAMWRHAVRCMGATDLVVALDPPVADYYEALFGFRRFTSVHHYRGFGVDASARDNDPVVGLWHDLPTMERFARRTRITAPAGEFNAYSLYDMPYPAPYESVPEGDGEQDLTRYKLPRALFQRFFTSQDTPLDQKARDYLARSRSRETLQAGADTLEPIPPKR